MNLSYVTRNTSTASIMRREWIPFLSIFFIRKIFPFPFGFIVTRNNNISFYRIEWEDESEDNESWHSSMASLPLSSSEEDETKEFDSNDDSSDNEYSPRLCVR